MLLQRQIVLAELFSASRAVEEAKLSSARAEEAKEAAAKAAAAVARAEQASRQITVRAGYFESLKEMLSLAGREVVPVAGDGNCGFYAFLGCEDAIEHCRGRTRAPTARDYAAQQNLRKECVKWLQDRPQLTAWHAGMDAVSNSRRQSSWSDAAIKNLEGGKQSTSDSMGVYANEAALRAMAGLRKEPLVVVDSRAGPSLSRQVRNRPPDQVAVYETHAGPEDKRRWFASVMKWMSWANDIAPVLQRRLEGNQLEDDPKYRVIVHNGEPASSLGGHFQPIGQAGVPGSFSKVFSAFWMWRIHSARLLPRISRIDSDATIIGASTCGSTCIRYAVMDWPSKTCRPST